MKKSIFLTIIILILIVLSCSAVYAEQGALPRSTSDELETNVLSDMATYMKLSNPVAIDKTQNYLAVANSTTLFVQPQTNPHDSCYIELIDDSAPNDMITKIVIIDKKIIALVKNNTTISRLIVVDISDLKQPVLTELTGESEDKKINYSSIVNLTKKADKLTIVNNGSLIVCDIVSNKIVTTQTYTMLGTAQQDTFKFINGVGYIFNADNNKLHKCELNGDTCSITDNTLDVGTKINDYYIDGENIHYIDSTGQLFISKTVVENLQDTTFKQLLIFEDKILTTAATSESKDNGKVYVFDKSNSKKPDVIASKGSDIMRFDSPQGVYSDGNYIYIADTNNCRIIKRNISNEERDQIGTNNQKPIKVVAIGEKIYYIASGNLYCATKKGTNYTTTEIKQKVQSIAAYGNLLLILSENKIFTYDGSNKPTEYITNFSITADEITTANQTNFVYLIEKSTGRIVKYNLETLTHTAPQESIPQGDNYNIDFRGNLFVQKGNTITKFTQEQSAFTQGNTFTISGIVTESKISVAIDSAHGIYYFVSADDHLLFEITDQNDKLGVMGTNDILTPPTQFEIIKAGKANKKCESYITPDNPESAKDVSVGEIFLILANAGENYSEDYYYVMPQNATIPVYIHKKNLTEIQNQENVKGQQMSPVVEGVQVYKYPYKTADFINDNSSTPIILGKANTVTCVHKVAAYDSELNTEIWNWYKITFELAGNIYTGYVGCNYIAKITPPAHQTDIIFMKTKSPKIGTNIKIYAKASTDSEVLFDDVKDGIDIQILGKFDPNSTFTQVFYNDKIGYILNENLQPNGLTPNQIIAITITSVAVVAFIILGVLFMRKNKNSKNKPTVPNDEIL